MNKKMLKNELTKYARFIVSPETAITGYDNFELLFKYIGENSDANRKTYEGRAYYEIRKETDNLLKVSFIKDRKLKTSKSEVKTLRKCFKNLLEDNYTMKIPYKISYIFKAIINIVERIETTKPLPYELTHVIGICYGVAFYNKYINTYNKHFDKIKNDFLLTNYCRCRLELKNDFESPASPFAEIIK